MTITINDWPGFTPGQGSNETMRKIIVLSGTVAGGKKLKPCEKPVTVSDKDARFLVAIKKAKYADDPIQVENREDDLEIETREKTGKPAAKAKPAASKQGK